MPTKTRVLPPMVKDGKLTKSRGIPAAENAECDLALEPHVLTDKDEVKIAPCRTCRRPCIVTRFATPAKVACNEHRDRAASKTKVRDFDRTKEPHTLTDKEKTKEVPCRACGRPCIVNVFASANKVACLEHGGAAFRPKTKVEHVKKDGLHQEIVTVEHVDEEEIKRRMAILSTPGDPFWPDGSKEDRARLVEIATELIKTRWKRDRWRAKEMQRTKAPKKELAAAEASIESINAMVKPSKSEEDRRAGLEERVVEYLRIIKAPDELTEAELRHDELVEQRKHLRHTMVEKLIKSGVDKPYAEVVDEAATEVQRIQPRLELELLAGIE